MLKLKEPIDDLANHMQPPPRGCVLKLDRIQHCDNAPRAAASARLCVETHCLPFLCRMCRAAASARLCVETKTTTRRNVTKIAAASARLCVETLQQIII